MRMMRDGDLAADLAQDTFIRAYRALDSLEDRAKARAWLYQIAHRIALDEIRHRRIVRFLPSPASPMAPLPRPSIWSWRCASPVRWLEPLARIPSGSERPC